MTVSILPRRHESQMVEEALFERRTEAHPGVRTNQLAGNEPALRTPRWLPEPASSGLGNFSDFRIDYKGRGPPCRITRRTAEPNPEDRRPPTGCLVIVSTAVRALAAAGPSAPAIEAVGYEAFSSAIAEAVSPSYEDGLGVRMTSEFGWVTARRAVRT